MNPNYTLSTSQGIAALVPRNAVYWHKLASGWHVGYRKTLTGGSWHARHTDHDNNNHRTQLSLGSDIDFDRASLLAQEFCKSKSAGVDHTYTVKQAIQTYVEHRGSVKTKASADVANQTLQRHVPSVLLNRTVASLRKGDMRKWANSLITQSHNKPISKSAANRVISDLVAALNLAYDDETVDSKKAWQKLSFKLDRNDVARKVFFTPEQELTLLNLCNGQFRALVEAALLTGARPPGELINLLVRDFNPKKGTLEITGVAAGAGKTGARIVYLSDTAIRFFTKQVRGKLPNAWLIPNDKGHKWGMHAQSHQWLMLRNRNLKLPKHKCIPADSVMYSCRHTFISKAILGGMPTLMIAANVGTSAVMIEKHYAHFVGSDIQKKLNEAGL